MSSKQKARYIGPDGGVNNDVARETRKGAKMRSGEVYEVSEGLFRSLMLSADWEAGEGSEDLRSKTLEDAQKASDRLSKSVPEGMPYAELVASQEEHIAVEDVNTPENPPNDDPDPRDDDYPEDPPEDPDEEFGAEDGAEEEGGDNQ